MYIYVQNKYRSLRSYHIVHIISFHGSSQRAAQALTSGGAPFVTTSQQASCKAVRKAFWKAVRKALRKVVYIAPPEGCSKAVPKAVQKALRRYKKYMVDFRYIWIHLFIYVYNNG